MSLVDIDSFLEGHTMDTDVYVIYSVHSFVASTRTTVIDSGMPTKYLDTDNGSSQ